MNTIIKVERLGGDPWDLIVHESEDINPSWTCWDDIQSTQHIKRVIAYVKRLGKYNGGSDTWHIVPFTSVKDGSKWFSLYVG